MQWIVKSYRRIQISMQCTATVYEAMKRMHAKKGAIAPFDPND